MAKPSKKDVAVQLAWLSGGPSWATSDDAEWTLEHMSERGLVELTERRPNAYGRMIPFYRLTAKGVALHAKYTAKAVA